MQEYQADLNIDGSSIPLLLFIYNVFYDIIQYECLQIASLFLLSNCCILFIPDDGLRISWNIEQNNVFDNCGYIVCNKNLLRLHALFTTDLHWVYCFSSAFNLCLLCSDVFLFVFQTVMLIFWQKKI